MNAPMFSRSISIRAADLHNGHERARIDAFVTEQPDGTPFHLTGWTVASARGTGQRPHFLMAERGDGRLAGVLPLTELHSPLFGRALVSAGFGVDGGILCDDARVAASLAEAAWALSHRLTCPSVELRGGSAPGDDWDADSAHYLGHVRNLAADDATELLAIPRKQRAEVRKALDQDLEIVTGRHRNDVALHYAVYSESVRNLGTPVFPRRLFQEVLGEFEDSADTLLVMNRGTAVSGVLSLYWRGCVYPYWGGGTHAARSLRANDRMYFALMGHARALGCTRFDFGRSKVGTGAAAFKKNWGFDPRPLTYYRRAWAGYAAREVNPLSPKYRLQIALWQRLPLTVTRVIGPWIAKGLG